jgi:hypothetical protein
MISFSFPFSLDDDRERLVELQRAGTRLVVRERRFLVEAQKPG